MLVHQSLKFQVNRMKLVYFLFFSHIIHRRRNEVIRKRIALKNLYNFYVMHSPWYSGTVAEDAESRVAIRSNKSKNLFHDYNASSHTSNIAQTRKHELGFESLQQPSYSSDRAASDYNLFSNLKRWLCGRRFETNEEVEWETEEYFGGFDMQYYLKGREKLKNRCIELKGEYIEK